MVGAGERAAVREAMFDNLDSSLGQMPGVTGTAPGDMLEAAIKVLDEPGLQPGQVSRALRGQFGCR